MGDLVRLQSSSRTQNRFQKAYHTLNTEEIFKVYRVDRTQAIPTYYVKDLDGEIIEGAFYREELIKTTLPDHFQVDVLKTRKYKGNGSIWSIGGGVPTHLMTG